jgi:hypothetical protein
VKIEIRRPALLIFAGLAGLVIAAPFATAQTRQPAAAAVATSQNVAGPLAPLPKMRKRSRLRPRFVQPRRRSATKAKPRKAPRQPEFLRRGPLELPWEKEIRRFRQRAEGLWGPDPKERLRIALRKLNADPMLRLGYTANVLALPEAKAPEPVVPPVFDRYVRIDANGDGEISRQEYMRGNARFITVGPRGDARRRAYTLRLRSRFRGVDRNNDGRITPQELEGLQNLRF